MENNSNKKSIDKDFEYYEVLKFLDEKVKSKELDETRLSIFKEIIRDNKYVSTYIRALKLKMTDYHSIDDFIKMMDKHEISKSMDDVVDYEIRQLLDSIWNYKAGTDPIKLINDLVYRALDREGKICDFRDSTNPDKIFGKCQGENHYDLVEEPIIPLTEDEQKEFDKINDEEGWNEAVEKFDDKFNPEQELELTLYTDEDTNKFDDKNTCYVCTVCMDDCRENNDCEVSCDME